MVLFAFLFLAWRYFRWDEISRTLGSLSPISILIFVLVIFLSRILYAFRWYLIGRVAMKNVPISLAFYVQTNLLAEFVTIIMPTSLGGEVARVLKLNSKGSRTTLSTASLLLDRALGIGGMLAVSLISLALIGRRIQFDLNALIPERFILPLVIGFSVTAVLAVMFGFFWLRNPLQQDRLKRAWELVKSNLSIIGIAFLVSMAAHVVFSLAHYLLLSYLYPLGLIETIAVILTPQLARSIPISVLGISAGEGLMVAGQMLTGMPRETAMVVTLVALASRYLFAFVGFLVEFLKDGIGFFKKAREPQVDDGNK